MIARTRKATWAVTHQFMVVTALLLFPVALLTERVGIPFGAAMQRFLERTNEAYENATEKHNN